MKLSKVKLTSTYSLNTPEGLEAFRRHINNFFSIYHCVTTIGIDQGYTMIVRTYVPRQDPYMPCTPVA